MWMLQDKETNEIIDPRSADFALSPNDIIEGADDWDTVLAIDSETDLIDGFAVVWIGTGLSDQALGQAR